MRQLRLSEIGAKRPAHAPTQVGGCAGGCRRSSAHVPEGRGRDAHGTGWGLEASGGRQGPECFGSGVYSLIHCTQPSHPCFGTRPSTYTVGGGGKEIRLPPPKGCGGSEISIEIIICFALSQFSQPILLTVN